MASFWPPARTQSPREQGKQFLSLSFSLPDLLAWHLEPFQHSPVFSRHPCISLEEGDRQRETKLTEKIRTHHALESECSGYGWVTHIASSSYAEMSAVEGHARRMSRSPILTKPPQFPEHSALLCVPKDHKCSPHKLSSCSRHFLTLRLLTHYNISRQNII